MTIHRRDFLKLTGLGGAAAFSCADRQEAERLADASANGTATNDADLTWGKAPCRFCGTGCGVEVGVRERHSLLQAPGYADGHPCLIPDQAPHLGSYAKVRGSRLSEDHP